MVTLVRQQPSRPQVPELDASQRAVLDLRVPVVRVLGGPGTGKSLLACELLVHRVGAGEVTADRALLIAPTRRASARLREAVTARLGATSSGPLARTPHSLAFGILRRRAARIGEDMPRLITGPEQDAILRELLEGYAAEPALDPGWPPALVGAVGTRTFRGELRDLMMRALELGLGSEGLAAAGLSHMRPEWTAAARVLADYEAVTALSSPGALDPAALLGAAAARLAEEPDLLAEVRADLRLVVVDDAQELTPAAAALLQVLVGESGAVPGPDLVLLGDPDSAAQTFRGGEPSLFVTAWPDASVAVLTCSHRLGPQVDAVADRVRGYIGAVGGGAHRRVEPLGPDGTIETHVFRTAAQEAAWVTDRLRRRHLSEGLSWADMAVLARSGSALATLERVLRSAGVPVATESTIAVRDHPAVRPFLTIASRVLEALDDAPSFTPDEAADLLASPLGGADALTMRRLRRALRRSELAGGGSRRSADLLAAALVEEELRAPLGPEGASLRRLGRTIAAGRDAACAEGATIESILWAMWTASGLASAWEQVALGGGVAGRRADAHLDAMVALFDRAAVQVERAPGQSPQVFLDTLLGQDLAADTLAARAPQDDAVTLCTPAEAAGREWSEVLVVGVEEGVWPDPRLRGLLLGGPDLLDAARGRPLDRRAARAAVVHDETRLFHVALTRTRGHLTVSAVRGEERGPSAFLDVVDPGGGAARPPTEVPRPLSLPGLIGATRQALVTAGPGEVRAAAARTLDRLARAGVTGADPAAWWGALDVSDERPRRGDDVAVRMSPSHLDRFARCQLQWFLSACGGQGPSLGASQVGILVHAVAHDLGDVDAGSYAAEVRARWGSLGLPSGWLSRRGLEQAVQMTGRLAAHIDSARAQGWERVASEVVVDVTVGRARIRGQVDRVEQHRDGRLRIIDLKTGSSKPTAEELARHQQLGAYQVALAHGGLDIEGTPGGAALLQLGRAASTRTPLQAQVALADDPDPAWAEQAMAVNAQAMAGSSFSASPRGGLCGTCQVASSCPARAEGRQLT